MVTNIDADIIREFPDRGTLWLLESPENLREFIRLLGHELADRLDFVRAERINRSLVPADLHKQEADLIYRVPFLADGREVLIYLLLEHQSKVDRFIGLRLHSYMGKLWEAQARAWEDQHTPQAKRWLSPIIPIVFYTGTRRWKHPLTLDAAMDLPEALAGFVPRHDILSLKLLEMPPEALTGSAIALALRVLQAVDAPLVELSPLLSNAVAGLDALSLEHQAEWRRALHFLLLLIYHRRAAQEQDELNLVIREAVSRQHKEEVDQMVTSSAQVHLEEGRVKGRVEGRTETLLEQLECRFGPLPARVTSAVRALPPARLQEITRQVINAQSLADLHLD